MVAGPRGIGKSSFLDDPLRYLDPDALPSAVSRFAEKPPLEHVRVLDLDDGSQLPPAELCVHVDMFTPLAGRIHSLDDLRSRLRGETYAKWGAVAPFGRAEALHVFTLFAPPGELFKRWILRADARERKDVSIALAAIYGLKKGEYELFRRHYDAWFDFVETLPCTSKHVIDTTTTPYAVIDQQAWREAQQIPHLG